MEAFIFHNPTKIIFGRGKIGELGKEIRPVASRVLLVYGQGSIRKYGVYDQIVRSLEDRGIERAREAGVDALALAGVWQLPEYTKDVMIEVLRRCTIPFPG